MQVEMTDEMMLDIIANYKNGGSVKDLARYYQGCIASAGCTSFFFLTACYIVDIWKLVKSIWMCPDLLNQWPAQSVWLPGVSPR